MSAQRVNSEGSLVLLEGRNSSSSSPPLHLHLFLSVCLVDSCLGRPIAGADGETEDGR